MILTEFFCNSCQFISDNRDDLDEHSQLVHQSDDTISRAVDQAQHETVHGDFTPNEVPSLTRYNCGTCEFSSEDGDKVNIHIVSNHKSQTATISDMKYKKSSKPFPNQENLGAC